MSIHLGLCCLLHDNKEYKFRTYTKARLERLSFEDARTNVHEVLTHNSQMLGKFFDFCRENSIPSYRLSSDLIPHFEYITGRGLLTKEELDEYLSVFGSHDSSGICLSMHPGQHVAMGSNREEVIANGAADLRLHKLIQDAIGFKEMNIHLGGAYGDKPSAKARFIESTQEFKDYLTIENDELTYNIDDCLEVSESLGVPVTFDLHHHRCHQLKPEYTPQRTEREYFLLARQTWIDSGRDYQRIHVSSPRLAEYTTAAKSRPHHDYITPTDIPSWLLEESKEFPLHIDVEAKAKEKAIMQLNEDLDLQSVKSLV